MAPRSSSRRWTTGSHRRTIARTRPRPAWSSVQPRPTLPRSKRWSRCSPDAKRPAIVAGSGSDDAPTLGRARRACREARRARVAGGVRRAPASRGTTRCSPVTSPLTGRASGTRSRSTTSCSRSEPRRSASTRTSRARSRRRRDAHRGRHQRPGRGAPQPRRARRRRSGRWRLRRSSPPVPAHEAWQAHAPPAPEPPAPPRRAPTRCAPETSSPRWPSGSRPTPWSSRSRRRTGRRCSNGYRPRAARVPEPGDGRPRLRDSRRHRHPDGAARSAVVAVVGDGSSLYSIQALWSAAHYRVGALFVILANGGYAIMDRLLEREGGARRRGRRCEIDISGLARAFGCPARRVTTPNELVERSTTSCRSSPTATSRSCWRSRSHRERRSTRDVGTNTSTRDVYTRADSRGRAGRAASRSRANSTPHRAAQGLGAEPPAGEPRPSSPRSSASAGRHCARRFAWLAKLAPDPGVAWARGRRVRRAHPERGDRAGAQRLDRDDAEAESVSLVELVDARIQLEVPLAGPPPSTRPARRSSSWSRRSPTPPGTTRRRTSSGSRTLAPRCHRAHRRQRAAARVHERWTLDVLQPLLVARVGGTIDGGLIIRQHRAILRAIRQQQPAAAQRAMRRHLEYVLERTRAVEEQAASVADRTDG